MAFLGEAPGSEESSKKRPFCGPAGGLLSHGLTQAGIERFRSWVFNTICCQPTGNHFDTIEAEEARRCCLPGFKQELDYLTRRNVKVIVPLGASAMTALGLPSAVTRYRGSVYQLESQGCLAVPTFHPAYLLRGLQKEIPTWISDLEKAKDLTHGKYKPPRENFNLFPSLGDLEAFVDRAVGKKSLIAVDIETIGIRADRSTIYVVGLASSSSDAISVPFFSKGMVPYWNNHDLPLAKGLLAKILDSCPTLYQNALFDCLHLRQKGFKVGSISDDVLLAHHAVHPELPHNLGYIVSLYGSTPYWKDDMKLRPDVVANMDDEVLRRYNLRDAVVLHQVLGPLNKDLEEVGTTSIYQNISMKLIPVLLDMTSRGILLDQEGLKKWKVSLERKAKKLNLEAVKGLPVGFNLDSGDHLRLLLFGERSSQFDRADRDLLEYDDTTRKRPLRRDTAKYRSLIEIQRVSQTQPLWSPSRRRRTESGKASTDDEALLSLRLAANERLDDIRRFVKKKEIHLNEAALIQKTLKFLDLLASYRSISKLLSTYSDFPIWPDGAVHTSFMIHGTATGRLSSREPNLQNIPTEVRKLFVARPGFLFVEADYSNLEPRILAYISGDEESIKVFESGKNIHDANTIALFPWISKDHPKWKDARYAAKKYRLAMNYGGGLYSTYRKVYMEAPSLGLTFETFQEADRNYQSLHAAEGQWIVKTGDEAVRKRMLKNAFGRIRIFLGTEDEVRREGVNFPIQSTAADITNPTMIRLHSAAKKHQSHLLLQVHDSLLFEVPRSRVKAFSELIRKEMETKVKIGKRMVSFPVEIKVGSNWGTMEEG
jgi:uracil-DNA glycosylase family 4